MTDKAASKPRVALALQGGGAHGAYTRGVIERLLEADMEIVSVSGASAGALNGAALVAGLAEDGPAGARAALERLWHQVSRESPLRVFDMASFLLPFAEPWLTRGLEWSKLTSRYMAPFVPGLRDMSALRRVVGASIDLAQLTRPGAIPLHVSATRVSDGQARLFTGAEVTLDALMASACLPDLFAAVRIDGDDYWDGGFSANPALEPLIFADDGATDLLVVQVTPFAVEDAGDTLPATIRRVSDISFNACLMRDLKALVQVQQLARAHDLTDGKVGQLAAMHLHLMTPAPGLATRGAASKLDTRASALQELRVMGHAQADAWLKGTGFGPDEALRHVTEVVA
ncbi:patatin-like phospholipase family protein [Sphingomonas carotinifaciens]|uniref:patatin-like phospholipase family protein n=1 Tax=Sphingomonas carotinifaciens TaxID=1166323 RepID=UPI000DD62156|nr:patatin-like phospholipase family protein [Sphingomonas carotinifaciens]